MKLRTLIMPLIAIVALFAMTAPAVSGQGGPPGPTSGTKLTGGLISPRGMKIGPDGMLYVAEAGTGGAIAPTGAGAGTSGLTGRISAIDLATGERTTVIDRLPSNTTEMGDTVGPADVAFIGDQLFYAQTHAGEFYGFPDTPTGVYKVNRPVHEDATTTLVADIGAFNFAHPVDDVAKDGQPDIEVGGNPYAMIVRDGKFLVSDGNQNQIMQITTEGDITRLAEFHGHPVTTGLASASTGPLYVTTLGRFPFAPADGALYQVSYPSGGITKIASGVSSVTDVEMGAGGQLYAINFGDQATAPDGPPWQPFSGKLMRVDAAAGTLTPLVSGFTFATAVIFQGDTAYVTSGGITVPGVFDGEIWKIENVSGLAPLQTAPPPAPTTAPPPPRPVATATRTGVTAPDTGSGSGTGGASGLSWLALVALAVTATTMMGAAVALKRR